MEFKISKCKEVALLFLFFFLFLFCVLVCESQVPFHYVHSCHLSRLQYVR